MTTILRFCGGMLLTINILFLATIGTVFAQGESTWMHVESGSVLSGEWSDPAHWSEGVPSSGAGISSAFLTNTVAAYMVDTEVVPEVFEVLTIENVSGFFTLLNIGASMDFGPGNPITLRVDNGMVDVKTGGAFRFTQPSTFNNFSLEIGDGAGVYWHLPANRIFAGGGVAVHDGGFLTTGVSGLNFLTFQGGAQLRIEAGGVWEHTTRNLTIGADSIYGPTILTNRGTIVMSDPWCRFSIGSDAGATFVHEVVMESGLIAKTSPSAHSGRGIEIGTRSTHAAAKGRFTMTGGVVTNLHELMIGKSADTGTSAAKIGRSRTTEGELRLYGGTWIQGAERVQLGGWSVAPENGIESGSHETLSGMLIQAGGIFHASGDILLGNGPGRGFIDISGGRFVNTNATGSATMILGLQSQPTMPETVGPGIGTLNIQGGHVTLDHLVSTSVVATVGSSTVTLHGGTLEILRSATVGSGTTFAVGDGTGPARLVLGDGFAGTFDEDLTIAAHAVLAVGHSNATASATLTGNLILEENARLEWKFDNSAQDLATVTGTVTLPVSAMVALNGLDSSTPGVIPLITAAGGFIGNPENWPPVTVNGADYLVVVDGNSLQMRLLRGPVFKLH